MREMTRTIVQPIILHACSRSFERRMQLGEELLPDSVAPIAVHLEYGAYHSPASGVADLCLASRLW